MDQDDEQQHQSLNNLQGLNERAAEPLVDTGFSRIEGLYPLRVGLLARVNGIKLLKKFPAGILGLAATYGSTNSILVQTTEKLYLISIAELYDRMVETDLEE